MKIFELCFDIGSYQSLRFMRPPEEILSTMALNGRSWRDDYWRPPPLQLVRPDLPAPNIWHVEWLAAPVVGEKARRLLSWPVGQCEALPLTLGDTALAALNIIDCLELLDRPHCQWPESGMLPTKYAFCGKFTGRSLVKTPLTAMTKIFCVECSGNPEKEFKAGVEKYQLTGVHFDFLWAGEPYLTF